MIRTYRTALFLAFMLMTINALAAKGDTEAAAEGWQRVADGAVLVDVRSPEEFSEGHAYGALNLPMGDEDAWGAYLANHPEPTLVLYCGSGRRAGKVQEWLAEKGVENVFNASGLEALQATQPTAD